MNCHYEWNLMVFFVFTFSIINNAKNLSMCLLFNCALLLKTSLFIIIIFKLFIIWYWDKQRGKEFPYVIILAIDNAAIKSEATAMNSAKVSYMGWRILMVWAINMFSKGLHKQKAEVRIQYEASSPDPACMHFNVECWHHWTTF